MGPVIAPPTSDAVPRAGAETVPSPPVAAPRRQPLGFVLAALLTVALLTPPALLIGRPPSAPRLTVIGTGDGPGAGTGDGGALSLLLEGVGGGRVLIGGGASGADLPAALARTAPPWRDRLDLLLVADARDLPGATELVRRGRVGQVATVGLTNERDPNLLVLRERCAASGVPLRAIEVGERIAIGRGESLRLDIQPGPPGGAPTLLVQAGELSTAIIIGAETGVIAPALVIVPHGSAERYRAALAGGPRLLVAPDAPTDGDPAARTQLLLVAPGQQSVLTIVDTTLHLRGGTPVAFPSDVAR